MSNNILSRLARRVFPPQEAYDDPHLEHYNRTASGGSVVTNKSELRAVDIMNEIGPALKDGIQTHYDAAAQTEAETGTAPVEAAIFLGVLKEGVDLARHAGAPSGDLAFARTLLGRAEKSGVQDMAGITDINDHMQEKQGWLPEPLEWRLMRTALRASQNMPSAEEHELQQDKPNNQRPSSGPSFRP